MQQLTDRQALALGRYIQAQESFEQALKNRNDTIGDIATACQQASKHYAELIDFDSLQALLSAGAEFERQMRRSAELANAVADDAGREPIKLYNPFTGDQPCTNN